LLPSVQTFFAPLCEPGFLLVNGALRTRLARSLYRPCRQRCPKVPTLCYLCYLLFKLSSLPYVSLVSSLSTARSRPASREASTVLAETRCPKVPTLCYLCYLLFKFSSLPFVKARRSQPANIPRPPSGVIAPNHLKLVNAKVYKEPLKTITPASIS
jgi:hypothetical protein